MSQHNSTLPQPNSESEPTDVRFSLKSLLLIAVPIAVIAAIARQCIRRFEPAQQSLTLAAWAGWLLLVICGLAFMASKRVRVEKAVGRTIMRLPIYGMNPIWRVIVQYMFSVYLLSVVPISLLTVAGRAARAPSLLAAFFTAFYLDSFFLAWLTAVCIVLWWWPQNIRLCEDGVLWDRRFIRWSDSRARWDPDRDAVTLHGPDQNGAELVCDAVVPEDQRGAIEALLNEKLPAKA